MPITLQSAAGTLTKEAEQRILAGLTETILRINGATGNAFALKHLIAAAITVPEGRSFRGGKPEPFVNLTLRVPTFSLATHAQRQQFVKEMTDLILEQATGTVKRDQI